MSSRASIVSWWLRPDDALPRAALLLLKMTTRIPGLHRLSNREFFAYHPSASRFYCSTHPSGLLAPEALRYGRWWFCLTFYKDFIVSKLMCRYYFQLVMISEEIYIVPYGLVGASVFKSAPAHHAGWSLISLINADEHAWLFHETTRLGAASWVTRERYVNWVSAFRWN